MNKLCLVGRYSHHVIASLAVIVTKLYCNNRHNLSLHLGQQSDILQPFPLLKREWKYGAGEGLLIGRGAGTFPIKFLHLEITESSAAGHSQQPTSAANTWCILQLIMTLLNYFTYCKIVLWIWRKNIFYCHLNFMKKVILSCLKINLKISCKLK